MKKIIIYFILALILIGAFLFFKNYQHKQKETWLFDQEKNQAGNIPESKETIEQENASEFAPPLNRAGERITKKPFGIFITPKNSPIQSERFSGYHTGTDFEIFPEELQSDVFVKAVCPGKLIKGEYINGYGGVAIQDCELNGEKIKVLYGHLRLESLNFTIGSDLNAGEKIGLLGRDKSQETSGERKHLHLGFFKGSEINVRGYVQDKNELENWIDPCLYVCE